MGLEETNKLLLAISRAQTNFLEHPDSKGVFESLLADFLALSESDAGFIGEVLSDAEGQPFLKVHANSNAAWAGETQNRFQSSHMDSQIAAVLGNAETLISNGPADDLPQNAFLGMPVMSGDKMLGMIGLANRDNGYDQAMVDYLKPLTETYGRIIGVMRANNQPQALQQRTNAGIESHRLGQALNQVHDSVFIFDAETLLFTWEEK